MSLVFHPAAAAEHFDQVAYYNSLHSDLGAGYVEEVGSALRRIKDGIIDFPL